MDLSPKTKIDDLLSRYPFLLEFLIELSPKYKLLQNRVTRKTIGKVATLAQVASIGELDLKKLLSDIADEIREKSGEEVVVGQDDSDAGVAPHGDNASAPQDLKSRQEILKSIIRDLHDGEDMEVLKQRFSDLIENIKPTEIAAMEQALIDEGMPESEVKRLCDVHVEVFQESLEDQDTVKAPAGHPIHTFMLESRAAEELLRKISQILDKVRDLSEKELIEQYSSDLERLLEQLSDIDLHYLRKENQLFPLLEEHEVKGPSQVMWALHDDIRAGIKTAQAELAASLGSEALNTIRYVSKSIEDMIYKEEHILFPMAMEMLSDADWRKVSQGESDIGYAWVVPEARWPKAGDIAPTGGKETQEPGILTLSTGQLTTEQVNLLLTHLPVEVNFVDENDEVRYFSKVKEKIFPRSSGVIGRKVQNCHPRASLDKVQRILDEFRSGEKDVAAFWIEMKGKFIYIRYFAVRDEDRAYRGTIEVVQDVTEIRGLTGQKRLLDWD
ncbi:MAG: DUF438 domain-containing protein [Thermoleophilia bacterium]